MGSDVMRVRLCLRRVRVLESPWFSAGLTAVRRDAQRRQPEGSEPAFDPQVFKIVNTLIEWSDEILN